MRDLREQLEESLGSQYVIERELGGAGMSRVFVARETALGRHVVVKVLPPGLTGVNVQRFHREILLSARLQHPHIVPVHSAGDMQGTPYYTMPLIEGESLRERIAREGPLPLQAAVHILRDVIDALAYAHEHGIVHRDIKPDNIILCRGHALVLDFGVAKALQAANTSESDDQMTTGGVAIGTPAYMAPEQAAGDPSLDHRSDLYAFGILAYETLTGDSPFAGRAPHEMLAANLTERPPFLSNVRAEVPASLASLLARCLEKRPEDRPATAADVRRELDTVITPVGTPISTTSTTAQAGGALAGKRRWSARVTTAAVAVILLVMAAFAALGGSDAPALDESLVAVMPFRVNSPDPSLRYLSEGMLDLFAAKLNGEGGPRSADPRAIFSAWRRAGGSESGELARDRAMAIAENLGAGQMLIGAITSVGERVVLSATLIRVRDGRAQVQASVEGHPDSLQRLVDNLTAQLLAAHAGEGGGERLDALTSTSLPALRSYLSGWSLYRRGHYAEAAEQFDRAVGADSSFALAGLGMARAATWFGDPALVRRGLALAHAHRDRLGPRDRALLDAVAGPNYPKISSAAEIHQARLRFRELSPDRAEAWFELGDSYFHFGHAIGITDAHDRAADAFRRAIALDSAFAPALEHLLMLAARAGDTTETQRVGELYLALDSLSEGAAAVRWRMAAALDQQDVIADLLRDRHNLTPQSAYSITMISQLDGLDMDVAESFTMASLERATGRAERQVQLMTAHDLALNRGRPSQALALTEEMAAVESSPRQHLRERMRDALFWDGDVPAGADAARQLERAVAAPMPTERPERLAYTADLCMLELWKVMRGDTGSVRASVGRLRDERLSADIPMGGGCATMLEAIHVAPRRSAEAARVLARFESLLASGPGGMVQEVGNLIIARLHEARGDIDGARAALRRREYFLSRTVFLSTYLREQARLAELAGDRAEAAAAYRHYLAVRSDPEPLMRRDVEWARDGLKRVAADRASDF